MGGGGDDASDGLVRDRADVGHGKIVRGEEPMQRVQGDS